MTPSSALLGLLLAAAPLQPPLFPNARVFPVYGEMESGGIPVRLMAQEVRATPAEALAFYFEFFERVGLPVRGPEFGLKLPWPTITAVDLEQGRSYVVFTLPLGRGECTVVWGVAELDQAKPLAQEAGGLLLFPGAQSVTALRLGPPELAASSVVYLAPADPAEVRAYYKELMPQRGFRLEREDNDGLVFAGPTAWQLSIGAASEQGVSAVAAQQLRPGPEVHR